MPLLELRELDKHFGGLAAVDGVSFGLNDGELVGLIGPNGAGKTTLFNAVTGFLATVRVDKVNLIRVIYAENISPPAFTITVRAVTAAVNLVLNNFLHNSILICS